MNLATALLRQLYARGSKPGRSLRLRLLGFSLALTLLAAWTIRFCPEGTLPKVGTLNGALLLYTASTFLVVFVFVLTHGYQQALMSRVKFLALVPLTPIRSWAAHALAFAPASLVAGALSTGAISRLFGVHIAIAVCNSLVAIATNVMVMLAYRRVAQPLRLVLLAAAGLASWSLYAGSSMGRIVGLSLIALQLGIAFGIRPIQTVWSEYHAVLHEYRRLGVGTAVLVRAARTSRYRAMNFLLIILLATMSLLAHFRPSVLPFDAAVVVTIALMGVMGQEIHALSRPKYPVELVNFGLLGRWVRSMWLLCVLNAFVLLMSILLVAGTVFNQQLSVGWVYVVSLTGCLVAAGFAVSSLLSAGRDDILMQFGSAGVYTFAAWFLFKFFAQSTAQTQATLLVVVCAASFIFSYVAEEVRWYLTTGARGSWVFKRRL